MKRSKKDWLLAIGLLILGWFILLTSPAMWWLGIIDIILGDLVLAALLYSKYVRDERIEEEK